jgi:hypothetical protein
MSSKNAGFYGITYLLQSIEKNEYHVNFMFCVAYYHVCMSFINKICEAIQLNK